jgi:D-arginine dehydrogenase
VSDADFLIVGGGVAGLSAGARLARHGRVVVLEAEEAIGFHASGRSATFSHFGIGNRIVRALTAHSRTFFLEAGEGVLARRSTALFVATEEMVTPLEALGRDMAAFTDGVRAADQAEMLRLFPPLRTGGDAIVAGLVYPDGLRLDSDAMLQRFARDIREAGGEVLMDRRIERAEPAASGWRVEAGGEAWAAPAASPRWPESRRSASGRCAERSSSSIRPKAPMCAAGRSSRPRSTTSTYCPNRAG